MENPNIKELLVRLSNGKISKDEFFLFLQQLGENADSLEVDQAFREFFEEKLAEDKSQNNTNKPINDSDLT